MFGAPLSKTTHEFDVEFIDDVLQNIDLFLRGTGFFPSGTLEYVQETFDADYLMDNDYFGDGHDGIGSTLDDYPELHETKSQYYFDTERNK
jgi:hypothetical protein